MELRRYLAILRRRWLPIVLTVVVGASIGYLLTDTTGRYTTVATLYVGTSRFATGPDSFDTSNDRLAGLDRIVYTFSVMIDSTPIAQDALDRTGLRMSAESVVARTTAAPVPRSNLLRIGVTDVDPVVAQLLANALADAFVEQVSDLEQIELEQGDLPAIPAQLFEPAALPVVPASESPIRATLLGAVFGFLLAAALTMLADYLDVTFRTAADVEARLQLPVLGTVPIQRATGFAPVDRRLGRHRRRGETVRVDSPKLVQGA